MASPSSPPATSSRKRRSLRLSSSQQESLVSPYTSGTTNGSSMSRRSSQTSQTSYHPQSPITPRPTSVRSKRKSSSRLSIGSNISLDRASIIGAGNLADELEGAWEDDMHDNTSSFLEGLQEGNHDQLQSPIDMNGMDHFEPSISQPMSPLSPTSPTRLMPPPSVSPKKQRPKSTYEQGHRKTESLYDGSDYGPDSDEEPNSAFTPSLMRRIHDFEEITRLSTNNDDTVSEDGGVVKRTTHALRDLGPQSAIENGITRLSVAFTSINSYRASQTLDLFRQAHTLLYNIVWDLPPDLVHLVIHEVEALNTATAINFPPTSDPLTQVQAAVAGTIDLINHLRNLTDLLQELRIQTNTAARKLKSVKEMVEDMRMEEDLVETSMLLIQAGDWDRRCRTRQAAQSCRDVVQSFGQAWDVDWDERSWIAKRPVTAS